VYSVALPRYYNAPSASGRAKKYLGPASSRVDFVIKVVNDEIKYSVEVRALAAISQAYNEASNDLHYSIGSCSFENTQISLLGKRKFDVFINDGKNFNDKIEKLTTIFCDSIKNPTIPFTDFRKDDWVMFSNPCLWRDSTFLKKIFLEDQSPPKGGTIVMRVGKVVNTVVDVRLWLDGVLKCLRAGWKVGWSQGDGRLRNTMLFGNNYQLIDYNHAVKLSRRHNKNEVFNFGKRVFSPGSLYSSLGPRLAKCDLGVEIEWNAMDDFEMIVRTLLDLMSKN
jgi:hypothetical protein